MRFQVVPRSANNYADSLASLEAAVEFQFRWEIPIEHFTNPNIQQLAGEVLRLDTSAGWRSLIISYLKDGTLPDDRADARKLQHIATRYIIFRDILYQKSYSNLHPNPYLRCLGPEETWKVMQEIHDGDCGNHVGGRSLNHKVINQGYYWSKMFDDTKDYVRKCPQCHMFALASNPAKHLHTLCSPWLFMQWGQDVVGSLPRAQSHLRFLLATTDYFTKWIEAIPLSEVSVQQIVKFF